MNKIIDPFYRMELLIKSYPNYISVYGKVNEIKVIEEENKLNLKFPKSFRQYLLNYGAAGYVITSFVGIGYKSKSNVYTCTISARKDLNITDDLIFILSDDDVMYFIDTSQIINEDSPIVKYDYYASGDKLCKSPISNSFGDFFIERFIRLMKKLRNVDIPKDKFLIE